MDINLKDYKFTKTHEWVKKDDGVVTIGISSHAEHLLGDLVYVEFPDVGQHFNAKEEMIVVESVKAAADVYAPLSGEIIEVNEGLRDNPGLVNTSPYQEGWLVKLKLDTESEEGLLTEEEYDSLLLEEA